jgi:hypothetical protein
VVDRVVWQKKIAKTQNGDSLDPLKGIESHVAGKKRITSRKNKREQETPNERDTSDVYSSNAS